MAYSTASLPPDLTTAAQMQAWAAPIEAILGAGGMVRTSDTGQTNASALTAYVLNTPSGYQVWRFNDSLQATVPVFMKIEFGGGAATGTPCVFITVGTGSDGSGGITGVLIPRYRISASTSNTTVAANYYSAGQARFSMMIGAPSANASRIMGWGIERTKDSAGADTGEGLLLITIITVTGAMVLRSGVWPFSGLVRAEQTALSAPISFAAGSTADGANVGMAPIYPVAQGGAINPGMNFMAYYGADMSAFNPTPASVYGASHTYIPLGGGITVAAVAAWTGSTLAMRYE